MRILVDIGHGTQLVELKEIKESHGLCVFYIQSKLGLMRIFSWNQTNYPLCRICHKEFNITYDCSCISPEICVWCSKKHLYVSCPSCFSPYGNIITFTCPPSSYEEQELSYTHEGKEHIVKVRNDMLNNEIEKLLKGNILVYTNTLTIVKDIRLEMMRQSSYTMLGPGLNDIPTQFLEGGFNSTNVEIAVVKIKYSNGKLFRLVDKVGNILVLISKKLEKIIVTEDWEECNVFVCSKQNCKNPYPVAYYYYERPVCYFCRPKSKVTCIEYPRRNISSPHPLVKKVE
jgi:hypothetical protein